VHGIRPRVSRSEMYVRPVATGPHEHREAARRVLAEHPVAAGRRQQLLGPLDRELVGSHVVGNRGPILPALDVGPVAADAEHDLLATAVEPDRYRVDLPGVDLVEVPRDRRFETGLAVAEVEAAEPGDRLLLAVGYLVEVVLHAGREPVVDQIGEVALEQPDHGEGDERGDERAPLLPDVTTVLDG